MKLFNLSKNIDDDRTLVEKARDLQNKIEVKQKRLGKGKYGRVLKMARKPTDDEYSKTSKITFAGILIIGGLGFLIWLLASQLAPWIADQLGLM